MQHRSPIEFNIRSDRILIFVTHIEAALAVAQRHARIAQNPTLDLAIVPVPETEKQPPFGSFAFRKAENEYCKSIDAALARCLGSGERRRMMAR